MKNASRKIMFVLLSIVMLLMCDRMGHGGYHCVKYLLISGFLLIGDY